MATTPTKKQFRFTGMHMLATMIAFFGVIIVINLTMATFASWSWTGLVVKNSYVASQNFNDELAQAKAQAQRGWLSHVSYQNGQIEFTLRDKSDAVLTVQEGTISIGRPAFEQQDRHLQLTPAGLDRHVVTVDLADGTWMLRIDARVDGKAYRRDLRLVVNDGTGKVI